MKHQHQTFVLQMIKHGDKIQAYRAAYPKCANDETARKSADRLLRHHPEVAAEIEESAAYIRQRAFAEAYQQHVEQQKTPLLSMLKRREILAQIATSEMKVGRFVKDGDRYKMLFEDQRPRDMMRAMEIDLKMEEACNRLRNCNDPYFSQFNIYIDGRPCDQPHLPPDPNLPPGIFMLHRSRKNFIDKTGINRGTSPMPQIENQNPCINRGTSSMPQIENQNPGIIPEHLSRQGGENQITSPTKYIQPSAGGVPIAIGIGVQLAPDKNQNHSPNPQTNLMPQIENQNPGIIWEQNKEAPRLPVPPVRDLGELVPPRREENGETPTGLSHSGEVDEGSTSAETHPDPLAASFYKQELQARASAPPPHILSPEEVKAQDEEYARQRDGKQLKPSTFGKMYFKEKGISYDNLE